MKREVGFAWRDRDMLDVERVSATPDTDICRHAQGSTQTAAQRDELAGRGLPGSRVEVLQVLNGNRWSTHDSISKSTTLPPRIKRKFLPLDLGVRGAVAKLILKRRLGGGGGAACSGNDADVLFMQGDHKLKSLPAADAARSASNQHRSGSWRLFRSGISNSVTVLRLMSGYTRAC